MYNFTLPPPVPAVSPLSGFTQGLTNSLGAVQQLDAQGMKNALMQEEIKKRKDLKSALAGYGQPGFDTQAAIQKVLPIDPEMAIKMQTMVRTASKDQLEAMAAGVKIFETLGPGAKDNPDQYVNLWKRMESMGLSGVVPHPATFMNQQTGAFDIPKMNQTIDRLTANKELMKAELDPGKNQLTHVQQGDNMVYGTFNSKTNKFEPIPGMSGPKQGMGQEITLPDGTVIKQGTGGGLGGQSPGGLQKTTQSEVEKNLIGFTDDLMKLTQMKTAFQPSFQTYGGQISAKWAGLKGKLSPDSLSADEKKYLEEFSSHRSSSMQLMSDMLKRLSGTAVTDQELKRAQAYIPNTGTGWTDGDNPVEFESKMERFTKFNQQAVARLNFIRKNGLSIQNIPLDQMDDIIKNRGKAIASTMAGQNIAPEKMAEQIKKQLAQEFGLVY